MTLSFVLLQPFTGSAVTGASASLFICRTRVPRARVHPGRHGAWRAVLTDVEGDERVGGPTDSLEEMTDAAQPELEVVGDLGLGKPKKKEDKAGPASRKKAVESTVTEINNVAATSTPAAEKESEVVKPSPASAVKEKPKKRETRPRISDQQMKTKREVKEKQEAATRETQKAQSEKRKELVMKVVNVLKRAGDKTQAIRLGFEARQRVEGFLDTMVKKKQMKKLQAKDRLQVTAAELIRKSSSILSTKFDEVVVPAIKKRLPEELREASNVVIASGFISLVFAFTLFPTFFFQGPQKSPERKQLDTQTAYLERKLRTSTKPSTSSADKSPASKTTASIFPDDQSRQALYPLKRPSSTLEAQKTPTTKDDTRVSPAKTTAKTTAPGTSSQTLAKKPDDSVKPPAPVPPLPTSPSSSLKAEKPKPGPVTAAVAETTVKAGVGSQRAGLITAVDFDSLSPSPTIMVTVSPDFRRLPTDQQQSFTRAALTSARSLDFDGVSVVDNTGDVLSYGGLTVTVGDETRALRAKIDALRKDMGILAGEKADYLTEVHSLTTQLRENDEEVAKMRSNYEGLLKSVRAENAQLGQELARAETEIAKLPDVEVLAARTEAAEADSAKMTGTVEMLSRQVTVARDAESAALTAKRETEENAALAVKAAQEGAKKETAEAQRLVAEAEKKVETERDLREKNQQIALQEQNKAVEDTVAKYTRLLDDMQKQYVSEMGVSQKEAEQKYASLESSFKDQVKSLEEQNNRLLREVKASQDQGRAQKSAWEKEKNRLGEKLRVLETRLAAQRGA